MKKVIFIIFILFMSSLIGEANISDIDTDYEKLIEKYEGLTDTKMEVKDTINNISNGRSIRTDGFKYYSDENSSIRLYKFSLVLLLSITALLSLWIILKYIKVTRNSDNLFRLSAIIIILFMLGVIVIIAEDTTQISAVVGLLGAIAGYFLKEGREALSDTLDEDSNNKNIDKPLD
ncbi:MAG: hypothetical protein QM493_04350 [Sulfurovum sp.]